MKLKHKLFKPYESSETLQQLENHLFTVDVERKKTEEMQNLIVWILKVQLGGQIYMYIQYV